MSCRPKGEFLLEDIVLFLENEIKNLKVLQHYEESIGTNHYDSRDIVIYGLNILLNKIKNGELEKFKCKLLAKALSTI